jgi:accessory colonization factor AcfC
MRALRKLLLSALIAALPLASASATETLHVYGPGGPLPAMKEAVAEFGRTHDVKVDVVAGPAPQWIDKAKADADLIFSGSEVMMSDFSAALPEIDQASVKPLYLRPAAILGALEIPVISAASRICSSRATAFSS